ncbi:tetratricopeptide repeat protein [bacterium]|nr:tetratricopeptide repeat protein [bacterium]
MQTCQQKLNDEATVVSRSEDLARMVQAGALALREGDIPGALGLFEKVIEAFPDRPEGHNNLGALYTSLGEFARAEACFDRVLQLIPDNGNILYNRGLVRARQEKFETARLDFEAVLALNPLDPDAHNNLGVAAYVRGDVEEARTHFTAALATHRTHPNAAINLCDLEAAAGDIPRAVATCRTFLERSGNPEIRRKLVDVATAGAVEYLDLAIGVLESLVQEDEDRKLRQTLGRLITARSALQGNTPL